MDGGRLPMFLQDVKRFYPGLCYVRSVSAFNRDHVDCVRIIMIQNKNICVALAGGYREFYLLDRFNVISMGIYLNFVDCKFFASWSRWPLAVASDFERCLLINSVVMPGHDVKCLFLSLGVESILPVQSRIPINIWRVPLWFNVGGLCRSLSPPFNFFQ